MTKDVAIMAAIWAAMLTYSLPSQGQQSQFREVTEGVFQLRVGQSMDLTDQQILLSMVGRKWRYFDHEMIKCTRLDNRRTFEHTSADFINDRLFHIEIDGINACVKTGQRIDLKSLPSATAAVKAKERCLLDVVGFDFPNPNTSTATFRLTCK